MCWVCIRKIVVDEIDGIDITIQGALAIFRLILMYFGTDEILHIREIKKKKSNFYEKYHWEGLPNW